MKLKPEDYRAIKIKNGSTLITSNKNFDVVFNLLKRTEDAVEVPVTHEMLNSAEVLIPYKPIEIPKIYEFNYL